MPQPGDDDRSFGSGHASVYPDPIHLAIVRLDGKITTFIQTQSIREEALNHELKRIREDNGQKHSDHEARLRIIEGRRYVEPKTVWAAVGIFVTFGSLIVAIINLATR